MLRVPGEINKVEGLVQLLIEKNHTIAFAESMSGGYLAHKFAVAEGSGGVFLGSLVCYHSALKCTLLNVPENLISEYSAESMEVTLSMAAGLMQLIAPSIGVAITGLCSPGGSESETKPVGTVFVVFALHDTLLTRRYFFDGTPEDIINQTVDKIVDELLIFALRT